MTDENNQKTDPIELTEQHLDAPHGGATRRSIDLASGTEERKRDGKGGDANGSPVYDLSEDFAP